MEIKGLLECRMAPQSACPKCGSAIKMDRWNLVCGFKPEEDSKKTSIDGDHLSLVGVRIIGICQKCTQAETNASDSENPIGVYDLLSLSEFEMYVADHVVKFIADFNQGKVTFPKKDLSKKISSSPLRRTFLNLPRKRIKNPPQSEV